MAVAHNDSGANGSDGSSSPVNVTVSVGGSDRYLIANFVRWDSFARTLTVTWDPSGANEALSEITTSTNGNCRQAWFEKVGPSTGTDKTLEFAWSGGFGSPSGVACGGSSYTGVDATTSRGSFFTATGNTDPITVDVTDSDTDELVVDAPASVTSNAFSVDASQTQRYKHDQVNGPTRAGGSDEDGDTATVTMSWTYTEGIFDDWSQGATSLKPAAAGTTVTVGLASSTESALAVSFSKSPRVVGLASETDTGLAVTVQQAQTVSVGLASETNTALATTFSKSARIIGLAAETDTALVVGQSKSLAAGLASETDSALAATWTKALAAGLASETDTALAAAWSKALAVGLASETETALATTWSKALAVGLGSETDTGLAVSSSKALAVGLASDTETALAAAWSKALAAGLAVETDSALASTWTKALSAGLAAETDSGLAVSRAKSVGVNLATETGTALAVAWLKALTAGLATETDSALAVTVAVVVEPTQIHEAVARDTQHTAVSRDTQGGSSRDTAHTANQRSTVHSATVRDVT